MFNLIDLEKPKDKNYIILESLNQMKENCNIKSIHVITLGDAKITIGRGHESDVRINDISVSRTHAVLYYNKNTGRLLLRDSGAKFGTLVLIKDKLEIKNKIIQLQIGRTYIAAKLTTKEESEKIKKGKVIHQLSNKSNHHQPSFTEYFNAYDFNKSDNPNNL